MRYQKGQSGNPNGRPPKDQCVTSLLRELLVNDPVKVIKKWDKKKKKTGAMNVAIKWYNKLTKADMTALKEALDRVEGKVTQPISGPNGGPIEVKTDAKRKLASRINALAAVREAERITKDPKRNGGGATTL